jgi:hypothetical protein
MTLSSKQIRAVALLAAGSSVGATAAELSVATRQISRWRELDEFRRAERAAQKEIYDGAITSVVASMGAAVATLTGICRDTEASSANRISAARVLLEHALKAYGQAELDARLEAVEAVLAGKNADSV